MYDNSESKHVHVQPVYEDIKGSNLEMCNEYLNNSTIHLFLLDKKTNNYVVTDSKGRVIFSEVSVCLGVCLLGGGCLSRGCLCSGCLCLGGLCQGGLSGSVSVKGSMSRGFSV